MSLNNFAFGEPLSDDLSRIPTTDARDVSNNALSGCGPPVSSRGSQIGTSSVLPSARCPLDCTFALWTLRCHYLVSLDGHLDLAIAWPIHAIAEACVSAHALLLRLAGSGRGWGFSSCSSSKGRSRTRTDAFHERTRRDACDFPPGAPTTLLCELLWRPLR